MNHSFLLDTVIPLSILLVAWIVAMIRMRKTAYWQQIYSRPEWTQRSRLQKITIWLAVPFVIAPAFYAVSARRELLFPVFAMEIVQFLASRGTNALRLPLGWRLVCILPVAVVSIAVGAFIGSPTRSLIWLSDSEHMWMLASSAISFAVCILLIQFARPKPQSGSAAG